ncbi:putative pectinesterase 29 [Camellia lanceoleosa]|uniref:Pectinesterase 29 n=1 Tax=Camellia lanceoleosa TaxID=1840588 RepID=A0ACC0FRJ9_9ERIC|nr:putative pectinesterase 29 [Camellia lanceoleosa]
MLVCGRFLCAFFALFFISFGSANSQVFRRFSTAQSMATYPTIYVDQSGHGNFSTIQSAIDSIPSNNGNWICVSVRAGEYREQVRIPMDKSYIYIKGDGKRKTSIIWGSHGSIATSPTFISQADNTIVKSISFRVCGFYGFQDTLWDVQGKHYFKLCTIEGAVDFIFGSGQSIYERCTISVIARALDGLAGFITAQGRSTPEETNGFVFKDCSVIGTGLTYLGRPWREYARVIFYNSYLSDVVLPLGWNAWGNFAGREYQLTFAEHDCYGVGSNTSNRVKWEANLSQDTLLWLTNIKFIDDDGWISRQPVNMLT